MTLRPRQICLVAYQLEPVIETREWLEANCLDSILLEQGEG
jgi:hypothetical protein